MYVLSWRTVSVPIRVLLLCLFPSLFRNSGNKHKNKQFVSAETVSHLTIHIILYILRPNVKINCKKIFLHDGRVFWNTWYLHMFIAHHNKDNDGLLIKVSRNKPGLLRVIASIVTEFVKAQQVRLGSAEHNYSECVGTWEHRAVISKLSGGNWYGYRLTG